MKVGDLIRVLEKLPQDQTVYFYDDYREYIEVMGAAVETISLDSLETFVDAVVLQEPSL